jgi:excinuclease ABC subunit C
MRDGEGEIIYVGKARVLRNRLASYFNVESPESLARRKDIKTATLLRHVRAVETIIVANEYEALLLENTLIKQYSPRYNISLKDGKTYPVIRITAETFPRIFRTRHIIEDGSRYFGPFPNIGAVDTLLELIDKVFPLRKCRSILKGRGPCVYYHMGRCLAPCCGKISAADYGAQVERAAKLLAGETGPLVADLTGRMHGAARALRFERAAELRNALNSIGELSGEVSVVDFDPNSRDYIAWASEGVLTSFAVFSMREGRMTGRELYRARSAASEAESLETFIASYYSPGHPPPADIYLQKIEEDALTGPLEREPGPPEREPGPPRELPTPPIRRWFSETFAQEPGILTPGEKDDAARHHRAILAMVRQNAAEDLRMRLRDRGAGPALDELARVLALPGRPERIEGFDIAQLDGKHPVASLVSFKNGLPDKKNYRYFKLRTVIGLVDDFASIREAVRRRYSRLLREFQGAELPDLVLIDGGIGQVNAAKGVLDELGMDTAVLGLAKRDEEIWLPAAKAPLVLSRRSEALKVLQQVRDETHRFATGLNQKLRSKGLSFPALESVEGIGPVRAAAIMEAYGSLDAVAAAPPPELAGRCRLSEAAARAVRAAARLAVREREEGKRRLEAAGGRPEARQGRDPASLASLASLALDALAEGIAAE